MMLRRCVFSCALVLLGVSHTLAGTIEFDFNNGTAFDTAGSGVMMSATNGLETAVMTSVDILAPEYVEDTQNPPTVPPTFIATGNTLSAVGGDGVLTNVAGTSSNAIGVNNPSISNSDFETFSGLTTGTGESANFNFDETWVVAFDQAVKIALFNFSSIDAGDSFEVTVEDVVSPFSFPDGATNDDYADPFSGLVIPAGKTITFRAAGSLATTDIRITQIDIETIPEPASLTLLAAMLIGTSLVHPRRRVA